MHNQPSNHHPGWGTGFLNTTLHAGATGTNYGHNGATTASFRAGGDWARVLSAAASSVPKYTPYVTIQFGHNDQKPEKNISMAQLTANLETFVAEARAVHAVPILVTSLSRRRFVNATVPPRVVENLADVTAAAKEAARRTGAHVVDLNKASTRYLNDVGPEDAARYNQGPGDFTHLNDEGSVVFGNMVAMLIREEIPELSRWVVPVKKIEKALKKGKFIFPDL
jgi:lysophospholipase L1-like esterase